MTLARARHLASFTGTLTAVAALLSGGAAMAASAKTPQTAAAQAATGGAAGASDAFHEDEELILRLHAANHVLSEAIFAYQREGRVYIPVGEFAHAVGVAIAVDAKAARADGWFLSEARFFRLDLAEGAVVVEGRTTPLAAGDAIVHREDIYVEAKLLERWLPLSLDIDPRQSVVRLKTREPFPFEAKSARRKLWSRIGGSTPARQAEREAIPYRLFTPPAADVMASAGLRPENGEALEYQARASGDLLLMNASLFLRGTRSKPLEDARFVMERKDVDGGLPLGATHIALGDVFSTGLPMGVRSESGRGVFIGDMPLGDVSAFSGIQVRGEAAQGSEVELYRNGVLVAAQREVDGRYHFSDVPLAYGPNDLKLVFHGPRGERREEVRRLTIGDSRAPKGELRFSVSLVQTGTGLLGGTAPGEPRTGDGSWRLSGYGEYGLSRHVTAAFGAAGSVGDGARGLAFAGLRTGVGGVALAADAAADTSGGVGLQVGAAGKALGFSYALKHAEYAGGFADESRRVSDALYRRATELRLDRTFDVALPGSREKAAVSTSLATILDERVDGARQAHVAFRVGAGFGAWSVTNTLDYTAERGGLGPARSRLAGSLEGFGFLGETGVRARLDYEPGSDAFARGFGVAIDRRLSDKMRGRIGVTQAFGGGTGVDFALSREFRTFDLGLDGRYDTKEGFTLGVRFATSLGWSPSRQSWFQARPGLARSGAVEALVFRDHNGDGRRQLGEEAVADARVSAAGRQQATNRQGIARLVGLAEARPAAITVTGGPDENPYSAPARAAVEVTPRPGRIHVASFPMIVTGEVEGRVQMAGDGEARNVAGIPLQLVDAQGRVVAATRAEYDGRYLFEGVKPGRYRLEIDPEAAQKLQLALARPVLVALGPAGGVAGPFDVALGPAERKEPATQAAAGAEHRKEPPLRPS